jgi:hypothetical protein
MLSVLLLVEAASTGTSDKRWAMMPSSSFPTGLLSQNFCSTNEAEPAFLREGKRALQSITMKFLRRRRDTSEGYRTHPGSLIGGR